MIYLMAPVLLNSFLKKFNNLRSPEVNEEEPVNGLPFLAKPLQNPNLAYNRMLVRYQRGRLQLEYPLMFIRAGYNPKKCLVVYKMASIRKAMVKSAFP